MFDLCLISVCVFGQAKKAKNVEMRHTEGLCPQRRAQSLFGRHSKCRLRRVFVPGQSARNRTKSQALHWQILEQIQRRIEEYKDNSKIYKGSIFGVKIRPGHLGTRDMSGPGLAASGAPPPAPGAPRPPASTVSPAQLDELNDLELLVPWFAWLHHVVLGCLHGICMDIQDLC